MSYLEIRGAGFKGRESGDTNLGKVSAILMGLEQGVCLEKKICYLPQRKAAVSRQSEKEALGSGILVE